MACGTLNTVFTDGSAPNCGTWGGELVVKCGSKTYTTGRDKSCAQLVRTMASFDCSSATQVEVTYAITENDIAFKMTHAGRVVASCDNNHQNCRSGSVSFSCQGVHFAPPPPAALEHHPV